MIKLIASDLDGTILLKDAQSVDNSLFETIHKISEKGIIFAPASGRQYNSLKMLFEPIAKDLMYIAENGSLVMYNEEVLFKSPMDRKLAMEIIEDVYEHCNCEVLVSGLNTAYIKPKAKEYLHRMTSVVKYTTSMVDSFDDIQEDILKVSVCDISGIKNSTEYFTKKWSGKVLTAVSGKLYLDFTANGVNKGTAIKKIQEKLGISPDECMAFGDNYNDIEMLDNVGHSYAMDRAVEDIKKHAKHITESVEMTLKENFL